MLKFTFDTNCIIDLDEGRPSASFILSIIEAHRNGMADAAFVAVSASERQPGDYYLPTYDTFLQRLEFIGVQDIPSIPGLAYWGISYWGRSLWGSASHTNRERAIHDILFPNIAFDLAEHARANGYDPTSAPANVTRKWRNAWCDRQMLWAHDHHSRDVFVTSDKRFRKLEGCEGFDCLKVHTPEEAADLIA